MNPSKRPAKESAWLLALCSAVCFAFLLLYSVPAWERTLRGENDFLQLYTGARLQPARLPNRLYRNNGDSTFTDVTRAAGVDVLDDTSMSLFADADNDGDQDLILIGPNQPLLLRNGGKGRFTLDRDSGFRTTPEKSAMLTGAAMADYDNDATSISTRAPTTSGRPAASTIRRRPITTRRTALRISSSATGATAPLRMSPRLPA